MEREYIQKRVYWKGDSTPDGEFVILSEGGEERFHPILIDIDDVEGRVYPLPKSEPVPQWWIDEIHSVKKRINEGEIQKEVVYRKITLPTYGIHPHQILKGLADKDGTHFAIELGPNHILFGITPEKPVERIKNKVRVQILGGSGDGDWILNNEGMRLEHTLIQSDIKNKLNQNHIQPHISEITIKDMGYIRHLESHIHFQTLMPNPQLIPLLHPNLAIRGNPKGRGYFGGLIGWETLTELHLWLTIRCGVWDGERYHFWVGCGITPHSNAEEEWREAERKMRWLLT